MEKTVRACDVCEKEIEGSVYGCAICGGEYCATCIRLADLHGGGSVTGDGDLYAWLCPTHYQQVKEFIEGLKPKEGVKGVEFDGGNYHLTVASRYMSDRTVSIPKDIADALYNHMLRERTG